MEQMWFAAALAVFLFFAYRLGFRDAAAIIRSEKGALPKKVRHRKSEPEIETKEERLMRITMENIENFATDIPQKEVI